MSLYLLGIDTTKYKAPSIRTASGTKIVGESYSIQAVKEHANWNLNINAFEKFYYKPMARSSSNTAIVLAIQIKLLI